MVRFAAVENLFVRVGSIGSSKHESSLLWANSQKSCLTLSSQYFKFSLSSMLK